MTIYSVLPDNKNWGKAFDDDVTARRNWRMPRVFCSECGSTWALIGVDYPLVDPEIFPPTHHSFKPGVVTVDEYKLLREVIAPLLPKGLPIPPGTGLGPLFGEIKGKCGDFVWLNSWTLLVNRSTYQRIQSTKVRLPGVSIPHLKDEKSINCDLLEFQVEPRAYLAHSSYNASEPDVCRFCGRDGRKVVEPIVDRKTIPSDLDIFRIINFPTYILVTERFRDLAAKFNLTNIRFELINII